MIVNVDRLDRHDIIKVQISNITSPSISRFDRWSYQVGIGKRCVGRERMEGFPGQECLTWWPGKTYWSMERRLCQDLLSGLLFFSFFLILFSFYTLQFTCRQQEKSKCGWCFRCKWGTLLCVLRKLWYIRSHRAQHHNKEQELWLPTFEYASLQAHK